MRILSLLPVTALFAMTVCHADSPLPPPARSTVCSPSKMYCVDFVPNQGGVAFQIEKDGKRRELWRVSDWQRIAYVSDDGTHLAACYGGVNLIPQDYSPELVMVSIFEKGKLTHEIRLKDIISKFAALQKTVSHYDWGSCDGLSPNGMLRVNTIENNALSIDLTTGAVHKK